MRLILPPGLAVLVAVLGACAPVSQTTTINPPVQVFGGEPVPDGWRTEHYVSGLTLAVPSAANAVRLQGIDSRPMLIEGNGYTIMLDNYGWFQGPPNATLAGAPATVSGQEIAACRSRDVSVQLPAIAPGAPRMCDATGQNCRQYRANARLVSRCIPGAACSIVNQVLGSAFFAPPPHPDHRVTDPSFQPRTPVCRLPSDG